LNQTSCGASIRKVSPVVAGWLDGGARQDGKRSGGAVSAADRERWEARWRECPDGPGEPEPWLVRNLARLGAGSVLDVAAGAGRNALPLARTGRAVTALDVSATALARLRQAAAAQGLAVATVAADLDDPAALTDLGPFAAIVVVRFKPTATQWARLLAALAPGGRLLICTFGRERAGRGMCPDYCIDEHELRAALVPPLRLLAYERLGPAADWLEGSVWERAAMDGGSAAAGL
jgi:SAM-dependent methyltransferase